MKYISLILKIHQPFRLKKYRFFDIGNDHYYYDDFLNEEIITRLSEVSYIPMLDTLQAIIDENKKRFKCALSISGTAIEQFQLYVPEVIEKLKRLADTGCVEFLTGTYSHGLSSIEDPEEFGREVKMHQDIVYQLFGKKTKVFLNTGLIYDDDVALLINSLGFKATITEGAKHILGWKSPNFVYGSATAPKLKLLLTNNKLTTDISMRFNDPSWSEYPLTADKYINWIGRLPENEQVVNLFFSMDTFGSFLPAESGIFEFLKALPFFASKEDISFTTPSDIIKKFDSVGPLSVPFPLSNVDEARDVSAWRGNILQQEALKKLYGAATRVNLAPDLRLKKDWQYLQSSDHFYYMSTKSLNDGKSHAAFSPYESPFAAFTNYMNVLSDFLVRVQEQFPELIENEELNSLLLTIKNQASEIEHLKKHVKTLQNNLISDEKEKTKKVKKSKK